MFRDFFLFKCLVRRLSKYQKHIFSRKKKLNVFFKLLNYSVIFSSFVQSQIITSKNIAFDLKPLKKNRKLKYSSIDLTFILFFRSLKS
jgi:hypothetical protein